ncbi:MAG: hypothetical protein H6973_01805 [Gammaproteobacteria bacterium]|nr:hypothetical protein [Gammaproteobacteria bacterium]
MNFCTSSFKSYVLTTLALLTGLCVFALVATEWLIRTHVEPNDHLPTHLRLFQMTTALQAGFGDSHMALGFQPPKDWVNLAFPGESIDTLAYKINVLLARTELTRAIVQADAHMFAKYRAKQMLGYNEQFGRSPQELDTINLRTLSGYHRPKLLAYWEVWLRKGTFASRTRFHASGWIEGNDNWIALTTEAQEQKARERAALHIPMSDFAVHPFAADYQSLLSNLRNRGIQTCMVEFPVTSTYLHYVDSPNYQAVRIWFAEQARRLNLRLLAYNALYADQPDYFSDMDHLAPKGAHIFSQRIINDCFEQP